MRVGVNDRVGIAHDRDMAVPEDQIAALQFFRFRCIQRTAEAILLHVAVAWAAGAGGIQRDLDQTGAIDAEAALAAPQIGRADEPLGHGDEIVFVVVDAADMRQRQILAFTVTANAPSSRATVSVVPISSVSTGGSLIDGPGNAKVRIAVILWVGDADGFDSARSGSQPT